MIKAMLFDLGGTVFTEQSYDLASSPVQQRINECLAFNGNLASAKF